MNNHYHPTLGYVILHDQGRPDVYPAVYEPVVFVKAEKISIHDTARVDSFVKIEGGSGVIIGKWVHIASFCHINAGGGQVAFEEGSCAASGVIVLGGSSQLEGISCSAAAPKEQQVIRRMLTIIGKNAILYAGAIVLPGLTIGEGAVVGAGAVVTHDVPPFEVWAGNPARFIKMRVGHEPDTIVSVVSPASHASGHKSRKH